MDEVLLQRSVDFVLTNLPSNSQLFQNVSVSEHDEFSKQKMNGSMDFCSDAINLCSHGYVFSSKVQFWERVRAVAAFLESIRTDDGRGNCLQREKLPSTLTQRDLCTSAGMETTTVIQDDEACTTTTWKNMLCISVLIHLNFPVIFFSVIDYYYEYLFCSQFSETTDVSTNIPKFVSGNLTFKAAPPCKAFFCRSRNKHLL